MVQYNVVKNQTLTNWVLYRWRYVWGYMALVVLFVVAVIVASIYAPGGLSQSEINMVGTTNSIDFSNLSTLAVVNLPLHLLQYVIFMIFGVSTFTIKLPAILISIVTAISLFFLLRRWFRPNVSILAMLIMVATGQLIFLSQSFTADILYVLYTSLILLFSSLIVQRAKHQRLWKILLSITIGLSLFTPYFWYINLGLLIVALIHPHPRHFLVGRKYRTSWILAICITLVFTAIAIYFGITNPSFGSLVFGLDSVNLNILANAKSLFQSYFWPTSLIINGQIAPIIDISALALMILGLLKTIVDRSTARTYMIWIWLLLALPLLLVRPDLVAVITVPLFILLAIGIETLLREWYSIFPKNPYARGVGLVLIIGLVGVMTLSGIERHTYGYKYNPEAVKSFNFDLPLIKEAHDKQQIEVALVSSDESPIYEAFSKHNTDSELSVEIHAISLSEGSKVAVTRQARQELDKLPSKKKWQLNSILTNDKSTDSDRLYIYKSTEK